MTARTQLIFTDNPGDLPATYTVPPSLEIVISSVFARFDGSGAGGDFLATLDILSQNGNLVSRVAVNSQTLAAGDSARVTWAPFLRRPAASTTPTGASLPFCYAQTSVVAVTGAASSFNVADYGTGTTFKTNDSAVFSGVFHDTGKTPEYGIRIPANKLARVNTWLQVVGGVADGSHEVGWIISGTYSVAHFGIADNSDALSSGFSVGVADDKTAPEALWHVGYMGDTADFTVGTIHSWQNWTNDPQDFQYGMNVTLLGDLPT